MNTTARVQLTIEILADSSWGKECSLDQVFKQAGESAIGQLRNTIGARAGFKIIGEPVVLAVSTASKP